MASFFFWKMFRPGFVPLQGEEVSWAISKKARWLGLISCTLTLLWASDIVIVIPDLGFSSLARLATTPNDATIPRRESSLPDSSPCYLWLHLSSQAGSHIQTLMGSQSLQHRSREQQPYEGNINKVTIQQFQSPLPIQIPSSQATRGPQPGRCLIQTKGQRSMDGYPEQVRSLMFDQLGVEMVLEDQWVLGPGWCAWGHVEAMAHVECWVPDGADPYNKCWSVQGSFTDGEMQESIDFPGCI